MSIVYFSSLYNAYRYLVVIYLYWNKYDIVNIGNIMAITEAGGLVFNFVTTKIVPYTENHEKHVFIFVYFVLGGIISFFPFIMDLTENSSTMQMGIIVLINGIIEISYGIIVTLNNAIFKKYTLNSTRWSVYSWATILTNIISIVFITCITILMRYTKDNEYEYTPFYAISGLFGILIILYNCFGDSIIR